MALSPDEIVNYPLKQAVRGYSVKQVDELLDQVADSIEQLQMRVVELSERLEANEERLAETSETEATLKRTLVTAQRAAEQSVEEAKQRAAELVDDARRESSAIVEQAKLEAEELRLESVQAVRAEEAEARRRRQAIEAHIDALRTFERDYRTRLRGLLEEQRRLLEEIPARPPSPPPRPESADQSLDEPDLEEGSDEQESESDTSNIGSDGGGSPPRLTVRVRDGEVIPDPDDPAASGADPVADHSTDDDGSFATVVHAPDSGADDEGATEEDRLFGDVPTAQHHPEERDW